MRLYIPPNMKKYAAISKAVKAIMLQTTPLVQSISIDEAYLDLSGTNRLHQGVPAFTMARLANDVQKKLGITVSIGLSYNKFLAKLASDMDKPNGFSVIGEQNIKNFSKLSHPSHPGVGRRLETKLKNDGIYSIFDLQRCSIQELQKRYGSMARAFLTFPTE